MTYISPAHEAMKPFAERPAKDEKQEHGATVGSPEWEAFSELFRKPVTGEGEDDETFVTYDGATLESSDP